MLTTYSLSGSCLVQTHGRDAATPADPIWFDLFDPTPEEDRLVEAGMGVSVPTRDDMREIEASSRLFLEDGAAYMTATVLCQSDTAQPRTTEITFILAAGKLATVRYEETRPFALLQARATRPGSGICDANAVFLGLIDAIVDRIADVLERVGSDVEAISAQVFTDEIGTRTDRNKDYGRVIRNIGKQGSLISKIQESLVSLSRLSAFYIEEAGRTGASKDEKAHLKTIVQDLRSLTEHAASLDNKVTFLLEATLGLVSLQQNTIVKIFSVLAVVFMPPTLIASVYGMNFDFMPELHWTYGYPVALGMMVGSVLLTYALFKWRNWL